MNLHRQALGGEHKLHQKRKVGFEPDLADLFVGNRKPGQKIRCAPHFLEETRGEPDRTVFAHLYRPVIKRSIRSRPRSSSFIEVAYEIRTCSVVPKASPGTTATCASDKSFSENCSADVMPLRKPTEIFG